MATEDTPAAPAANLDRLRHALVRLEDEPLSGLDKGLPPGTTQAPSEIARRRWRLPAGDLSMPALVLRHSALDHNIALMQTACDGLGAWFAPHGKTTMAPQLWERQLTAGAWAITLSTLAHIEVARAFGLPRVFVANELVVPAEIERLGAILATEPYLDLYVLVDSIAGVRLLADGLRTTAQGHQLNVLVELGTPGGRTGARTFEELEAVARAAAEEPTLSVRGVEGYEGVIGGRQTPPPLQEIDAYLSRVGEAAHRIGPLCTEGPVLVSAGGSQYPDRVLAVLGGSALPGTQLIVRSGGYVTHDNGLLGMLSPHGTGNPRMEGRLEPAIELWSTVLSRSEPGLAILGFGRRDAPYDAGLPTPLAVVRRDGTTRPPDARSEIFSLYDQHAFVRIPAESALAVGDLVGCGISHPCSAFDRWRVILEVDDDRTVVGAIRTFF